MLCSFFSSPLSCRREKLEQTSYITLGAVGWGSTVPPAPCLELWDRGKGQGKAAAAPTSGQMTKPSRGQKG